MLEATGAELRERARAGARRGYAPSGELHGRALALPVVRTPGARQRRRARRRRPGSSRSRTAAALAEFDRLVLHQAVTVVALELLRRRVADDTERRLAGDVLSRDGLRRAGRRGARAPARAVRAARARRRARAHPAALGQGGRRGRRCAAALRDEVPGGLAAGTGRFSCALLPLERGESEEDLFALAERVARARRAQRRRRAAAGAGRAGRAPPTCGARSTRRAARSRRRRSPAATAQRRRRPPRLLATFRDLGSFQLLLSLQDDDALRLFCDSILAPIEDGEGAYGGELMRSLEAFIECNGQWERAARQLYCHRHTLRYRIRRVEELTGRSLDSARDRIDFWLALRGRELVP